MVVGVKGLVGKSSFRMWYRSETGHSQWSDPFLNQEKKKNRNWPASLKTSYPPGLEVLINNNLKVTEWSQWEHGVLRGNRWHCSLLAACRWETLKHLARSVSALGVKLANFTHSTLPEQMWHRCFELEWIIRALSLLSNNCWMSVLEACSSNSHCCFTRLRTSVA